LQRRRATTVQGSGPSSVRAAWCNGPRWRKPAVGKRST
jgi:hypothetical protein